MSAIKIWGIDENSIIINASPFHHSLGQRHLFISLLGGAKLVLLKRFSTGAWINAAIKHKANFSIPVTTHLKAYLLKNYLRK